MEIDFNGVMKSFQAGVRGTLAVSKEMPVGFQAIRLSFELDSDASREQLDRY